MADLFSNNWLVAAIIGVLALLWFVRMGTKLVFGVIKAAIAGVIAYVLFKYLN